MGWSGRVASDTTNVCWNADSAARSSSDTRGSALPPPSPPLALSSKLPLLRAEPEGRAATLWGRPVCSSVWSTRPHSAALCVALPTSSSCCTSPARLGLRLAAGNNGDGRRKEEEEASAPAPELGLKTSREPRESRGRPLKAIWIWS
uniref:Phot1 n=1 Tax=Arundo donax TaxID=35708 RepID=A0A0A9EXG9_ARUDO